MQDVIVFGHGRYYRSKIVELKQHYHIIAFLDNMVKPGNILKDENGIDIYNPEDVIKLPIVPIITMSAKFYEMWQQLMKLGIEDERVLFGTRLAPCYDEVEKLFEEQDIKLYSQNTRLVLESKEGVSYQFSSEEEYKGIIRKLQKKRDRNIAMIAEMPLKPVSRRCGYERGTPIDRYYIEKFIDINQENIHDRVMEVADNQYTQKFDKHVRESLVMHVEGWGKNVVQINLETGMGVCEYADSIDCFICTQTIQMIYDMKSAICNIYQLLKSGGTALITIAGIAALSLYDYFNWGEYWRVTPKSMRKILEGVFDKDKIEIFGYGNVKTTIAFLYGVCVEDLREADFAYDDEQFPMLIGCVVHK